MGGSSSFGFDAVLPTETTQERVYHVAAEPILKAVLQGYNGTIFSYGQTGTGKTYTMVGEMDDEWLCGIVPRVAESLFVGIAEAAGDAEFTIRCSYLEIYLEKVRDLLDPSGARENLPIHESKEHGIWVGGATAQYVASPDEMLDLLAIGNAQRTVAATRANAESSRSHAVFIVTVKRQSPVDGRATTGKLCLVDLAGSEKIRDSDVEGQQLEELKINNKSLSALGMVINALTDGRSTHVPYRDSKLTRLLQEGLGGNARTALILTASPASSFHAETLSTLRFGQRAKRMRNTPRVNLEMGVAELKALLAAASRDIAALRAENAALRAKLEAVTGESPPAKVGPARPSRLDAPAPASASLAPVQSDDAGEEVLATGREAAMALGRTLATVESDSSLPAVTASASGASSDDALAGAPRAGPPPPFIVLPRRLSSFTLAHGAGQPPRNVVRPISALDATVAMRSRSMACLGGGAPVRTPLSPDTFRSQSMAAMPAAAQRTELVRSTSPPSAGGSESSTPSAPRRPASSGALEPGSPPRSGGLHPRPSLASSLDPSSPPLRPRPPSHGSLSGGASPAAPRHPPGSPFIAVTALGGPDSPRRADASTSPPPLALATPCALSEGQLRTPSLAATPLSTPLETPLRPVVRSAGGLCCGHEVELRAVREQEYRFAAMLGDLIARVDDARITRIRESMRGANMRSVVEKSNAILATVMVDTRVLREALLADEKGEGGVRELVISANLVAFASRAFFDCADAMRALNLASEEAERVALARLADGKFGGVLCPFV